MQHVCHDVNGPSEWKYDPETRSYARFTEKGEMYRRIKGEDLPDPMRLWQRRCDLYGLSIHTERGETLKPQAATFAMWSHWLANR